MNSTDTNAALSTLARRVAELEQGRAAVLVLHRPKDSPWGEKVCCYCVQYGRFPEKPEWAAAVAWPCPTARALGAEPAPMYHEPLDPEGAYEPAPAPADPQANDDPPGYSAGIQELGYEGDG